MKENSYERVYYERTNDEKRWNSFPGKEVINHISSLPTGRVLDIGCGTGEILAALPPSLDYTGVDASRYAVTCGEKKWTSHPKANFLTVKDAILPFADEVFDVALLFYSLEHLRNPKDILLESKRILKKGGSLIVVAPNLEFPFAYPNALRHKSYLYRIWFLLLRIFDYGKRIFGIFSFRVLQENFTEATGKYEKKDDDLCHVVSSFEVIRFLERNGFLLEKLWDHGLQSRRHIIRLLPCLQWYGVPLAAVFIKNR